MEEAGGRQGEKSSGAGVGRLADSSRGFALSTMRRHYCIARRDHSSCWGTSPEGDPKKKARNPKEKKSKVGRPAAPAVRRSLLAAYWRQSASQKSGSVGERVGPGWATILRWRGAICSLYQYLDPFRPSKWCSAWRIQRNRNNGLRMDG